MKCLLKQFETLGDLIKLIFHRESIKKYYVNLHINAFEQKRADKICKGGESLIQNIEEIENSKEFRDLLGKNYFNQQNNTIITLPPQANIVKPTQEIPIKRPRPPEQKKSELSYEIARICCYMLAESANLIKPSLIKSINRENHEIKFKNSNPNSIKMRGRLTRGSKRTSIDRCFQLENDHVWGRYLNHQGIWHNASSDFQEYEVDDEGNEAFHRVQKSILNSFKFFAIKTKKTQES